MAKLHTYTNIFHGTTAGSKYSPDELDAGYGRAMSRGETRDPAYLAGRRLWRKLCGIKECQCSDWKGVRV